MRIRYGSSDVCPFDLADSLSAICFAPGRTPTDRERALFFEILRTLIHDVDAGVRRNLAERLSGCEDAPHDLVMQLAGDTIEIAHPMLARSQVQIGRAHV